MSDYSDFHKKIDEDLITIHFNIQYSYYLYLVAGSIINVLKAHIPTRSTLREALERFGYSFSTDNSILTFIEDHRIFGEGIQWEQDRFVSKKGGKISLVFDTIPSTTNDYVKIEYWQFVMKTCINMLFTAENELNTNEMIWEQMHTMIGSIEHRLKAVLRMTSEKFRLLESAEQSAGQSADYNRPTVTIGFLSGMQIEVPGPFTDETIRQWILRISQTNSTIRSWIKQDGPNTTCHLRLIWAGRTINTYTNAHFNARELIGPNMRLNAIMLGSSDELIGNLNADNRTGQSDADYSNYSKWFLFFKEFLSFIKTKIEEQRDHILKLKKKTECPPKI